MRSTRRSIATVVAQGFDATPLAVAADGSFSGTLAPGLYDFNFAMGGYAPMSLSNMRPRHTGTT